MATATTNTNTNQGAAAPILGFIGGFFRGIGHVLMAMTEAGSRARELERLHAKSDAELAAMGLRRDEIVQYVFRDSLHV